MSPLRLLSTTLALLAVGAVPAGAATVAVEPHWQGVEAVRYAAAPGEANDLRVELLDLPELQRTVRVRDAGASIAPGAGCRADAGDPGAVLCSAPNLQRVIASLGDRDDAFASAGGLGTEVDGGSGADALTGDPGQPAVGFSGDNRTYGGAGDDRLSGGARSDQLVGGPGDDRLQGGDAEDLLCGDEMQLEPVTCLDGQPGGDAIDGGAGNDYVHGGAGNDGLLGGPGHDSLDGRSGDDWIDAAAGDAPAPPDPSGRFEQVASGGGRDAVRARDGAFDQVSCQSSTVSMETDPGDQIICGDTNTRVGDPPGPPPLTVQLHAAKLTVERAGVDDGRLDVLARITGRANGEKVLVRYTANGSTSRFEATVEDRKIRFKRRLDSRQRRLTTGILEITYPGNDQVRPFTVRVRAANAKARLQREEARIDGDVLRASGTISSRARGVVRFQLGYVGTDGQARSRAYRAAIRRGTWELDEPLPAHFADVGQLTIQFTGYFRARMRGEQDSKQVTRGQ